MQNSQPAEVLRSSQPPPIWKTSKDCQPGQGLAPDAVPRGIERSKDQSVPIPRVIIRPVEGRDE